MEKSKAIFGVSTDDIIEKIKIDSSKKNKNVQGGSPKQKTKTLLKTPKVIGHNTKKK